MTWTRLLLTWGLLALLMPVNGILREAGFKRLMAPAAAEWLSAATGIVLILAVTRWLFRIPAAESDARLLMHSVALVCLTVAYEFGIGFAGGQTLSEMLANYEIWNGRAWPLVLLVLAGTPWFWRGMHG